MKYFIVGYIFLYYLDLVQFIVYGKIYELRYPPLSTRNDAVSLFYLAVLEFEGFVAISNFYYRREISGIIDLILVRVELLVANLYIYIIQSFYLPVITCAASNLLLILYLTFYWSDMYNIILQSYSKKFGSDVNIRNVYIIRTIYSGVKRLTYILYFFLFLLNTFSHDTEGFRLGFLLLAIPVFMILVLERAEEKDEDRDAKYIVLALLLCLSVIFFTYTYVYSIQNKRTDISLLNFINSYHFILAFLLSLVDYMNFNKGLRDALRVNVKPKGRKL